MSAALCTLADVKAYLGIIDTNSDAKITLLIPRASDFIERQCSRTFLSSAYTEVRNGNNGNSMGLREPPIISVTSVTINGVPVPAAPNDGVSSGFLYDEDTIYIRTGNRGGSPSGGYPLCFTRGIQNVVLVYQGGFNPIPSDVNQACVELIAWKMTKSGRIDKKSETLAAQTVAFDMADMPAGCRNTMTRYSRTMYPP